jgi:hypothetical protein
MHTTTIRRALVVAGMLAGAAVGTIGAASASEPPPGWPGTPETLDWPRDTIVKPSPPPSTEEKPEGPLPEPEDTRTR